MNAFDKLMKASREKKNTDSNSNDIAKAIREKYLEKESQKQVALKEQYRAIVDAPAKTLEEIAAENRERLDAYRKEAKNSKNKQNYCFRINAQLDC